MLISSKLTTIYTLLVFISSFFFSLLLNDRQELCEKLQKKILSLELIKFP